jgi:hypothetical protein
MSPGLLALKVSDVLAEKSKAASRRPLVSVKASTSIRDCLHLLARENLLSLPVWSRLGGEWQRNPQAASELDVVSEKKLPDAVHLAIEQNTSLV